MTSIPNDDLSSLRSNWTVPPELESVPKPRSVKMSGLGKMNVYSSIFVSLTMLGMFAFIFFQSWKRYQDFLAVQHEGVHVMAHIAGKRYVGGKGSHYNVTYAYQVGTQNYQTETRTNYQYYQNAQNGNPIDALYLPSRPQISRIVGETESKPVTFILFLPLLGLVGFFSSRMVINKQIRILEQGDPAPGIVDKSSRTKGGYVIRYRFLNEMDQVIEGKSIVTGSAPIVGNTVTILYLPSQSSQNALYPMPYASLSVTSA